MIKQRDDGLNPTTVKGRHKHSFVDTSTGDMNLAEMASLFVCAGKADWQNHAEIMTNIK